MGSHAFFQGIFLTQGSNPGLLHCRRILYHLSRQGAHIHPQMAVCCGVSVTVQLAPPWLPAVVSASKVQKLSLSLGLGLSSFCSGPAGGLGHRKGGVGPGRGHVSGWGRGGRNRSGFLLASF